MPEHRVDAHGRTTVDPATCVAAVQDGKPAALTGSQSELRRWTAPVRTAPSRRPTADEAASRPQTPRAAPHCPALGIQKCAGPLHVADLHAQRLSTVKQPNGENRETPGRVPVRDRLLCPVALYELNLAQLKRAGASQMQIEDQSRHAARETSQEAEQSARRQVGVFGRGDHREGMGVAL